MITWAKSYFSRVEVGPGFESQSNHFFVTFAQRRQVFCFFHNNIGKAPDRDTAQFLFLKNRNIFV